MFMAEVFIGWEEYDASDVIKILVAINELGLQELNPFLQSFLIKNKSDWMKQNFVLVFQPKKSLISLIRHKNLQMSGIQVWKHVLKWGLVQNPELPSDPTSYSKDDFITLKDTLQHYPANYFNT
ncbi:hypothetical protein C1645_827678 [Glomus cerebriforme]|uniref:BACK domain-containing protein n=1 Tax=Glomus cerebriforme TaxID=658196 RepID=A0A397SP94_9GLOM|nr:hypothetical protein C1645_827678 [Glomus cerebriforme]